MSPESSTNIRLVRGNIFSFTSGLLVIPRSTSGSINDSFMKGLYDLGVEYEEKESALSEVEWIKTPSKKHSTLQIAYVTSVSNNSSDYGAIAAIANGLKSIMIEEEIGVAYIPLIGTGAGGLDPFFSYFFLTDSFVTDTRVASSLVVVLNSDEHLLALEWVTSHTRASLVRQVIERTYKQIAGDVSIKDVLDETDFYFEIARQRIQDLLKFNVSSKQKQELISSLSTSKGNFQEFIDSQRNEEVRNFLILIGEIITYLDSKAYRRDQWNKYKDRRAIARAGVRQDDWVKNILIYSQTGGTLKLPTNIKNAINYILNPGVELPILSERDRENISRNTTGLTARDAFSENLYQYFETVVGPRPTQKLNWGVIIARIVYSPIVKIIWDPDSRKPRVRASAKKTAKGENINNRDNRSQGIKDTYKNTYKARLHDDRFAKIDLLNYDLYAQTIVKFIKHESTQAPLTVGIFAPWGMGKTTLMKFIQEKFNEKAPSQSYRKLKINWVDSVSMLFYNLRVNAKRMFGVKEPEQANKNQREDNFNLRELVNELKKPPYSNSLYQNKKYPTVWFNAWKYENTEQILAGLAYEIINQLIDGLPNQYEKERFYLNLNRKRFDEKKLLAEVRSKIYGAIFNKLTIILLAFSLALVPIGYFLWPFLMWFPPIAPLLVASINSFFSYLNKVKTNASDYFEKFISQPKYEDKLGYFHEVERDLKKVFELMVDKENPCVIFIDDLDRCSSKKVVEVIEAINLFINGDFPHCYFVIGMDAQMVAASIEAAYNDIDKKLTGLQRTHGSLGWYFLEKFVQLQFIIPNLSHTTGREFLRRLLESNPEQNGDSPTDKVNKEDLENIKEQVKRIDLTDKKTVDAIADKLEKASLEYKKEVLEIKSAIIEKAANELDDTQSNATELLESYAQFLNVSPRVIKRFANLFRFYQFMQIANLTSKLNELQENEIAQMVIINLRWPQLPRLIQWNTEADLIVGNSTLDRAKFLDEKFEKGWGPNKPLDNGSNRWLLDATLINFVKDNKIKFERYVEVGVW